MLVSMERRHPIGKLASGSPVALLKYIRDGGGAGLTGQLREEESGSSVSSKFRSPSDSWKVRSRVSRMVEAGLLREEGDNLSITENTRSFMTVLELSLTSLAKLSEWGVVLARPFHGPPSARDIDVFVVMPFGEDLVPVYQDHIKAVCERLRLKVERADDFRGARAVVRDVWSAVFAAKVIIADCTGRNANVFYEIGLAHAVGTPTILITQEAADIPFDLQGLRHIEYTLAPRGMKAFEDDLSETLEDCRRSADWAARSKPGARSY
jgi:hypothetical protein